MKKHAEFKAMLEKIGLSYKELATVLGLSYDSLKSMLAPGKDLPRWAVSMLVVYQSGTLEGAIVEVNGKRFQVNLVAVSE